MVVSVERTPPTPHHFSLGPLKDKKQYPFFFLKEAEHVTTALEIMTMYPSPAHNPRKFENRKVVHKKQFLFFCFFH